MSPHANHHNGQAAVMGANHGQAPIACHRLQCRAPHASHGSLATLPPGSWETGTEAGDDGPDGPQHINDPDCGCSIRLDSPSHSCISEKLPLHTAWLHQPSDTEELAQKHSYSSSSKPSPACGKLPGPKVSVMSSHLSPIHLPAPDNKNA